MGFGEGTMYLAQDHLSGKERGQQPGQELRSREVVAVLASGRLWKVFGKYTDEEGSLAILEP